MRTAQLVKRGGDAIPASAVVNFIYPLTCVFRVKILYARQAYPGHSIRLLHTQQRAVQMVSIFVKSLNLGIIQTHGGTPFKTPEAIERYIQAPR